MMQPVVLNAANRPIRIDAGSLHAVRWIYKRHIIGIHYADNMFWVSIYLTDRHRKPTGHPRVAWAVFHYQDRKQISDELNKLLQTACASVTQKKFLAVRRQPFNSDYSLSLFIDEVRESLVRYKLTIKPFELASVIEHARLLVT